MVGINYIIITNRLTVDILYNNMYSCIHRMTVEKYFVQNEIHLIKNNKTKHFNLSIIKGHILKHTCTYLRW